MCVIVKEKKKKKKKATKSNVFARIVEVFKLMLLTVFVKSTIMDV